jgi:hypothetical protein
VQNEAVRSSPAASATARRASIGSVFISHSSHERFAEMVRDAVSHRLREARFEVLVDADAIRPGEEWEPTLSRWLARCRAAVLLISHDALKSDWVQHEASILRWRRQVGATVTVIPVLVGGVTAQDVAASKLGDLLDLQLLVNAGSGDEYVDAAVIAKDVLAQLSAIAVPAGDDRMEKWLDRVSYFLSQVGDEEKLSEFARELGVSDDNVHRVRLPGGKRFLAGQFLDGGLDRRTYQAVRAISDFLGREWLAKLVNDVAFTWVNGAAAHQLLLVARQATPKVPVLNARSPATADEYLDRATFRTDYWREVACTVVGEDAVDELIAHYEQALALLHGIEPPWTVADIVPRDEPCFLVVDPTGAPWEAVTEALRVVRERYPWVVFLLLAGRLGPAAEQDGWADSSIHILLPPLAPGEEKEGRQLVRDLRELVAK